VARAVARRAQRRSVNDNEGAIEALTGGQPRRERLGKGAPGDLVLRAALRHFAEYGLGAAQAAHAQAQAAFLADDQEGYNWWLGITRTLDRRLAAQAEESLHTGRPG